MKNKISVHAEIPHINTPRLTAHIKRCINVALRAEQIPCPCEINVLITDDEGIHAINRQFRNVDRETDVLSFPMFTLTPGAFPDDYEALVDYETGLVPLGDMALSIERIRSQAAEFGHSEEREVGYLTVHSVLHLLGYDHLDDGTMKKQMREQEKKIMKLLDIPR